MHFRIRKNIIQCVRTSYDPSSKKPKTSIVGKMSLAQPELTAELRACLSNEEIAATETWIKSQYHTMSLREELAALTLAETLSLANRWFLQQGESDRACMAVANLLPELQALRKTLRNIHLMD